MIDIEKIREYIKKTFIIDDNELDTNKKKWVREILHQVRRNNEKLSEMYGERNQRERDLQFMESSMVSGVSYDNNMGGKNTGGRPNNVLDKLEQQLITRDEIKQMIVDIRLLEKSLLGHNKMIEEWIWTTIQNKDYAELMISKYIKVNNYKSMTNAYFNYDYVRKAISLGIDILTKSI